MRDYGRVYSSFWTSEDTRSLSDDAKMLALYLLSGPHGTIAGVCRLPDGYVHEDLGWSIKRVREGFGELFRKGFANRCGTTEWVWICRFLAWNTPENPNQWKAARKIASSVPLKCSWKAAFTRVFAIAAGDIPDDGSNPFETLSKPLPTQKQDQDQKQEQKQDQKQYVYADAHTKFAEIKSAYPKFSGRQDWLSAEHHCAIRIEREGLTWDDLLAATRRYATYCDSGGVSGQQYVLTPGKFFSGADKPWMQPWDPPIARVKPIPRRAKTSAELEAEEDARNAQH